MEVVLLKIAVALLPVLVFLAVFTFLDAFKLMDGRELAINMAIGGVLAAGITALYLLNRRTLDELPIGFTNWTKYVAPVLEEIVKCGAIALLFWRNRIGFMIDAVITGFAVGAGFSLIENVIYLYNYPDANLGVWLVRGFGTAVMHGGAVAGFGVVSQFLIERRMKIEGARYRMPLAVFLPGLALAVLIHGAYNHFPNEPVLAMAVTLLLVPLGLVWVFFKSEHSAHNWLLHEYETHEHMLADIESGRFDESEAGRFVLALSERFDPQAVAAAFEYLKLHTRLLAQAEGNMIAHEEGAAGVSATDVRAEFQRLHQLEGKLGRTTLMAIRPHLQMSRHELWEIHELKREAHAH